MGAKECLAQLARLLDKKSLMVHVSQNTQYTQFGFRWYLDRCSCRSNDIVYACVSDGLNTDTSVLTAVYIQSIMDAICGNTDRANTIDRAAKQSIA
jgi:hypothetical protein